MFFCAFLIDFMLFLVLYIAILAILFELTLDFISIFSVRTPDFWPLVSVSERIMKKQFQIRPTRLHHF